MSLDLKSEALAVVATLAASVNKIVSLPTDEAAAIAEAVTAAQAGFEAEKQAALDAFKTEVDGLTASLEGWFAKRDPSAAIASPAPAAAPVASPATDAPTTVETAPAPAAVL